MSAKPAARLGDPTACPQTGHGTNLIASGSPDVLFDGLPAARQGDASACGGAMSGALIANVLINGKPAAVLGSVGSHGNLVIAGSGSVIIGDSHTPAPFTPPKPLAAALISLLAPGLSGIARAWQERPDDQAPLELEEEEEEEEQQQAITLRIGVFFDGTGNNLANAAVTEQCRRDDLKLLDEGTLEEVIDYCQNHGFRDDDAQGYFTQAPENSYGNAPSNVARLFELYQDDAPRQLKKGEHTVSLKAYFEGIGTSSGEADSLYGQATGSGDSGILARVRQSPDKVSEQLRRLLKSNPDLRFEKIEFDIFGFSRGAAAARHFANELLKPAGGVLAGALRPGQAGLSEHLDWATDVHINFIGLFDTVAAVVAPLSGDYSPANALNPGINLYLPPGCARKVLQLSARDERRWNFALNSVAPHHQEISLPGAHSDIGGGYRPHSLERLLLSRPLSSTVAANTRPEQTHAWQESWRQHRHWTTLGLPGDGLMRPKIWTRRKTAIRERGLQRPPQDVVYGLLPIQRQVHGELSLVYLRVMRELATQHDVPLMSVPDTPQFALPPELIPLAEKLMAYAQGKQNQLNETDERLLWSRYIHLSAHWTPSGGLLINKPAPNLRLVYNNKPQRGYPE